MPAAASASTRPSSPTTKAERTPRSLRIVAVTSADVTTSSDEAVTPTELKRSATCAGVRLELLVTNASRLPASRSAATASAAPGMGSGHR